MPWNCLDQPGSRWREEGRGRQGQRCGDRTKRWWQEQRRRSGSWATRSGSLPDGAGLLARSHGVQVWKSVRGQHSEYCHVRRPGHQDCYLGMIREGWLVPVAQRSGMALVDRVPKMVRLFVEVMTIPARRRGGGVRGGSVSDEDSSEWAVRSRAKRAVPSL